MEQREGFASLRQGAALVPIGANGPESRATSYVVTRSIVETLSPLYCAASNAFLPNKHERIDPGLEIRNRPAG